jgi:hypothetical protein
MWICNLTTVRIEKMLKLFSEEPVVEILL